MTKADKTYIEAFKEWLKEQEIYKESCDRTIISFQRIIESKKKQIELNKEITDFAIIDFNIWAEENNAEKIELINNKSLQED